MTAADCITPADWMTLLYRYEPVQHSDGMWYIRDNHLGREFKLNSKPWKTRIAAQVRADEGNSHWQHQLRDTGLRTV